MLRRSFVSLLAGLALVAACGGGEPPAGPPAEANIAGSYNLQSLNGSALPALFGSSGATRVDVTAGNFTINANNTFSNSHTFRVTSGGQVATLSETCTGTYARTGTSLAFTEAASGNFCGGGYNGSVSGNDLTVAYDAQLQAVYRR
jgi:hypothetical protein